jgi:hypothetical protein
MACEQGDPNRSLIPPDMTKAGMDAGLHALFV